MNNTVVSEVISQVTTEQFSLSVCHLMVFLVNAIKQWKMKKHIEPENPHLEGAGVKDRSIKQGLLSQKTAVQFSDELRYSVTVVISL